MKRVHLLRDVEEGKKKEKMREKRWQSWKMANAKDNERTGQEEDSRDEAEGGMDRWATAGSAVWEKPHCD